MNDTIEIDLQEIGRTLLKRFWIILLSAFLVGTAVLIYTANFVQPTYKSSITMYVNNTGMNAQYISSSDRAVALSLVETYINMISSNTVTDKVAEASGLGITGAQVRSMMTAGAVEDTEIFEVSVISTDPQLSADVANAIAEVAPDELEKFIPAGSTANVIDYARPAKGRYSPSYTTNTFLGLVVGAVLAVLVLVLQILLDIRVKREDDLTKIANVPVLGSIPELTEEEAEKKTKKRKSGK